MTNAGDIADLADLISRTASSAGDLANELPGIGAAYRGFCRIVAGAPGSQILRGADFPTICDAAWADDGIGPGASNLSGFSGGQCPTRYDISGDHIVTAPGGGVTNNVLSGSGDGPLSQEVFTTEPVPGTRRTEGRIVAQDGVVAQFLLREEVDLLGGGMDVTTGVVQNFAATPQGGGPNNCGDTPGVSGPLDGYGGEDYGEDITIEGEDGQDYVVNVDEPRVNDDGNFSIPVTIDGVEFDLGNGGSGSGVLNPGPSQAGSPIPGTGGEGEVPVPQLGEGLRCVAIRVRVSGIPSSEGIIPGTEPILRTYAPLGNVTVRQSADDGTTTWSEDQVIFQEETTAAIDVEGLRIISFRVNMRPGLSYTATPLYRSDTSNNEE